MMIMSKGGAVFRRAWYLPLLGYSVPVHVYIMMSQAAKLIDRSMMSGLSVEHYILQVSSAIVYMR